MCNGRTVPVAIAILVGSGRAFAGSLAPGETDYNFIPWFYYQTNPGGSGRYETILRNYQSIGLESGWELNLREDIPFRWTDKVGRENEDGNWSAHLSDVLFETTLSTPDIVPNILSLRFGGRLEFPSGGPSPFGTGRYQIAPVLVMDLRFPDWGHGVEFTATARYFMSVGKGEAGSEKTRKLEFYPEVKVRLGEGWSMEFWAFNPLQYNELTNKWFVPFDAMLVKHLSDDLSLGLGGAVKLVDDYPRFKQMIYMRAAINF